MADSKQRQIVMVILFCLQYFIGIGCSIPFFVPDGTGYYFRAGQVLSLTWLPDDQSLAFLYMIKEKNQPEISKISLYKVDIQTKKTTLIADKVFNAIEPQNYIVHNFYNLQNLPDEPAFIISSHHHGIYKVTLDGHVLQLSDEPFGLFGVSLSQDGRYLLKHQFSSVSPHLTPDQNGGYLFQIPPQNQSRYSNQFILTERAISKNTTLRFEHLDGLGLSEADIAGVYFVPSQKNIYFHTLHHNSYYIEKPSQGQFQYRLVHAVGRLNPEESLVQDIELLQEYLTPDLSNLQLLSPFFRPLSTWMQTDKIFFYQLSPGAQEQTDWQATVIQYDLIQKNFAKLIPAKPFNRLIQRSMQNQSAFETEFFNDYQRFFNRNIKLSNHTKKFAYVGSDPEDHKTKIMIADLESDQIDIIVNISDDLPKGAPHLAY